MSKEEIIAAVKKCATDLGHAPNQSEFRKHANVSKHEIRKNFGTYTHMMAMSEVEREGSGFVVELKSLFLDWAGIRSEEHTSELQSRLPLVCRLPLVRK